MLIQSSLPGAVMSHSRSSSHDEGQPAGLPQQPAAQPVPEPALVVEVDPRPSLDHVNIVVRPPTPGAEQPGGARELSAPGSRQEVAQRGEASEPVEESVAHGQPQPPESLGTRLCNGACDVGKCIVQAPCIVVAAVLGVVVATAGSAVACIDSLCGGPRNRDLITWGDVYRGVRGWVRGI